MVRMRLAHVMRAASSGSCKGGAGSVVLVWGVARTCSCFCRSMSASLTSLLELSSVRAACLEQRWGRDEQGAEHRPQCGLHTD